MVETRSKWEDELERWLGPFLCRFLGRRNADAIHVFGSRRPRSAKAGNRGVWGSDGAAGAMGI
jgi:hypothetical protein